ncbi:unnamed protein product [Schistosoma bovis]|nr:unnamed protein product [Schistosoma bovis]
MDFLTCASCMRNGICLPVTIVKCMVENELIFCQNKECIHYFLPLNFLSSKHESTGLLACPNMCCVRQYKVSRSFRNISSY